MEDSFEEDSYAERHYDDQPPEAVHPEDQRAEDLLNRLHHAFRAEDGSFLLKLRSGLEWDQAGFAALIQDMASVCELYGGSEMIERWLADGFWYLPNFIKTWIVHPDFPKEQLPANHALVAELLEDLAHWFFTDDCPWENPEGWLKAVLPPGEAPASAG